MRAWHTCFTGQRIALTAPEALNATVDAVAAAAEQLTTLGDAAGEAKAHAVHAQALARLGRVGAAEAALDRALAAARRAGDRRRANAVLAGAPLAALWGPSPVTRASGRCLDVVRVLRITQGAPAVEAVALSCQGVLEALRGRTEAARRMVASARQMVEELGIAHRLFEADVFGGRIDLLEGDATAAERTLRPAYDGLRDLGLGIDAARTGSLLARALLAQDRAAEAETLSHESEALAGDDLQAAIAWRGVRAEALARRGDHAPAIELAQAAVAIAAATDALLDHADARLALAAALRAAGRSSEADAEERRATELWEAKGATLLAERARRDAGRVVPKPSPTAERVAPAGAERRRVRANAATADAARLDAAVAARDPDRLLDVFADDLVIDDHTTGVVFDREGALASFRYLISARDPACRNEPLATLGDSLGMFRLIVSASGVGRGKLDVGAYEKEEIHLNELDADGRRRRGEVFATHHLGDAIERLYERHAELLPDGPARERAAATARVIAAVLGLSTDVDRLATVLAPTVETVDHRNVGFGVRRGRDALLAAIRAFLALVTEDSTYRFDDVLALSDGALLAQVTNQGRDRAGAFERVFLWLFVFDAVGLVAHYEVFEVGRVAEALARCDALTAPPVPARSVGRSVRPNAATVAAARFDVAISTRDDAALEADIGETFEVVDHPNGATYGRDALLDSFRRFWRVQDPQMHHELLATFGECLALYRRRFSASGTGGGRFDVGPFEREEIVVYEVDGRGLFRGVEIFTADHLSDAITCVYRRYADLLPEGPARTRAAVTARSVGVNSGPIEPDRLATALAASFQCVDHRRLGTWRAEGPEEFLAHWRGQNELADGFAVRDRDVLALAPQAFLVRRVYSGTGRDSGGTFENLVLVTFVFGADGLVTRAEIWEPECEAAALARFDELTGTPSVRRVRRRVRPNAASVAGRCFEAAFAARDTAALAALFSADLEVVDHLNGAMYGRAGQLDSLARLQRMQDATLTVEPLATLGESLLLWRRRIHASGTAGGRFDVGEYERVEHVVFEVDDGGCVRRIEIFAADHLGTAVGRVYARYAELAPADVHDATAWLLAGGRQLDALAFSPAIECFDHRVLGFGSLRGADAVREFYRAQFEIENPTFRMDDILDLRPHAMLIRNTTLGIGRASAGAYERECLLLWSWGSDGLLVRIECFDPDREAEALARFDELVAGSDAEPPELFTNAASRAFGTFQRCWQARDWDGVHATYHPAHRMDDRRRLIRLEVAGETFFANERMLFDDTASEWHGALLATRGERLALFRVHFTATVGASGPMEVEMLDLLEVDAAGRRTALVVFDPEDEDGAYAELEARYEAGEGAMVLFGVSGFARGIATRDWDALIAACAPTFVEQDHRSLAVLGTTRDAAAWAENFRVLVELAPDTVARFAHVRPCPRGNLWTLTWQGSRAGGAYEIPLVGITQMDEQGKVERIDFYDPEQLDQAWARFAELAATPAASAGRFENAASRAWRPVVAAWRQRDVRRFAELQPHLLRYRDHRRLVQLDLDREQFLEFTRPMLERATGLSAELLATRGERLALMRGTMEMAEGDVGPIAIDTLIVIATDEQGAIVAYERFDEEDLDAAYAELEARWMAGEGATGVLAAAHRAHLEAFERRDWDALAAIHAPDFCGRDHRVLGWGDVMAEVATFIRTQQALVELAPDARYRFDHVRVSMHAVLMHGAQVGTRDGGAFESPFVTVNGYDDSGLIRSMDIYDVEQLDQAWARFAALSAPAAVACSSSAATPSTPRFANAATAALERGLAAWEARDWERFAALFAADFHGSDRRALVRLELDREQWLASQRELVEITSARPTREVLATRGDRLALARVTWEGAEGLIGPSEIEWLLLIEVDGRGNHTAVVTLGPDDGDAAFAELDARYEAGEASAHPRAIAAVRTWRLALTAHDWDAFAAGCTPELVVHDHRLLGWGTLHGAAEWTRTQEVLVELAPDTRWRSDHVRIAARGILQSALIFGTRDGGPFEIPFLRVSELDAMGRLRRIDLYDVDRRDEARARFAALDVPAAADPRAAVTTPNAAMATMERWQAAFVAAFDTRDWDAMRGLCAPGFLFEDRRRLALLSGDRELMIASARERARTGARPEGRLVGTAGERVMIGRTLWSGGPPDGRFEIEYYSVVEVDEAELFTAMIFFDVDDVRLAQREAWARWGAIDPVAAPWVRLVGECNDSFDAQDRARIRANFADDLVVEDHRRTGFGRIEGADAYVESLVVLWDLAPDHRLELGWSWPAVERHGVVATGRRVGTLADGGAFESDFLWVAVADRGRVTHAELFELEDLARAVARLAELRPDPLRIPNQVGQARSRFDAIGNPATADPLAAIARPNAATAMMERWRATFASGFDTGDWEAMREMYSADMIFEDRRRFALLSGDRELFFAAARERARTGARPEKWTTVGTAGDRLVISQMLWSGGPADGRFEIEYLSVAEVDEAGLITATIMFDLDDAHAARREAWARWSAIEPAAARWTTLLGEGDDAFEAHDRGRLRVLFAADLIVEDHRRTGVGRIDGADAYVESVAVLWELAPDQCAEHGWFWPVIEPHGVVTTFRRSGTLPEGGEFESDYLWLSTVTGNRITRVELFELEDLERATARLAELRPDPLRVPPNAATRAEDHWRAYAEAGNWDAMRALVAPIVFEDRRRLIRIMGGCELLVADSQHLWASGLRPTCTVLATAGDRLVLQRMLWTVGDVGQVSEIEVLKVSEVDGEGRFVAMVIFDPDDRRAACADLFERFARQNALPPAVAEFYSAFRDRDLARMRASLPDDFVFDDHRRTGLGRIEGADGYLAAVASLFELSPDASVGEPFYYVVVEPDGAVAVAHTFGTLVDGGEFESVCVSVLWHPDGRPTSTELFEIEDLDRALARVAELRAPRDSAS
ncbi:MAG: nuclear transport factor 2 family protein [Candidatus Binatia bacterium]